VQNEGLKWADIKKTLKDHSGTQQTILTPECQIVYSEER